jgi:hypothetical protein
VRRLIRSRCAIPAARSRPPPTHTPAPTPTRPAPPHLSLDNANRASLETEADAISNTASGATFVCRSRCSLGLRASRRARVNDTYRNRNCSRLYSPSVSPSNQQRNEREWLPRRPRHVDEVGRQPFAPQRFTISMSGSSSSPNGSRVAILQRSRWMSALSGSPPRRRRASVPLRAGAGQRPRRRVRLPQYASITQRSESRTIATIVRSSSVTSKSTQSTPIATWLPAQARRRTRSATTRAATE